jgi:RHS repeat-associated protein
MPGRKFNSGNYRFGFNGKENDREWGNQLIQDYGFRLYNPAIGKFLSVDPLMKGYPMLTPYQFASNRPIDGIDLDGLEYLSANVAFSSGDAFYNSGTLDMIGFETVIYNSQAYYVIGQHLYYDSEGTLTTNPNGGGERATEWIYTDIQNFDNAEHHVYTWGDPTLTGDNTFGSARNLNCADLAAAQCTEIGPGLANGVVTMNTIIEIYNAETGALFDAEGGLDYINQQLEAGNSVVVGVHDGDEGGTDTRGTDHYVTIVGRSSEDGQGYFFFIDNAVGNETQSTDFDTNRITPGTGESTLGGHTIWGNRDYETTRVQENIED